MRYINIIVLFLFFSFSTRSYQNEFFAQSNSFFKTYVKNGSVGYHKIMEEKDQLKVLVGLIKDANLNAMSPSEEKAFLINTYNILTIHSIIENYPVKSVMDIQGFFDKKLHNVGGKMMTLDTVEKGLLMKKFFDPNLHFVLVCGAESCPPLASFAFLPSKVDEQVKQRTTFSLNDPHFIKKGGETYKISKIFEWYGSDFKQNDGNIKSYINQYRKEKIPAGSPLTYYEYNWNLND